MTPLKYWRCNKASKKTPSKEIKRLWINWVLFILLGALNFTTLLSTLPTLHQFVTNPVRETLNSTQTSLKIQSGLGQSETVYSLAVAFRYVGAFIAASLTGFLLNVIPYWHLNLFSLVSLTIGWTIYATAVDGWMVLLSRLLVGAFIGMHYTLTFAYFGESFEDYVAAQKELDNYGKRQAAMKDILFALHGIAMYLAYIVGLGVPALLAVFDITRFSAIAWFNVALGMTFIVLQLLLLRGESQCKKIDTCCAKCRCGKEKFKIKWTAVLLVVFLFFGRAITITRTNFFETLFNPILSDSFGLSEKWGSYIFFALVVPVIVGAFAALILRLLNVNTRIIAIIGIITGIIGALLMSDWQSIPYDPCTEFSLFHHPELAGDYLAESNNSTIFPSTDTSSDFRHAREMIVSVQQLHVFKPSVYNVARNKCEEARISNHRCHWIPHSIISKELCTDCQPICRSVDRSLNFIQFIIGVVLFEFSQPVARVSLMAIISDQVRRDLQGIVMGLSNAMSALLLIATPIWLVATYEGVGKRTFLPLAIMIGALVPLLVGLIVLYPRLGQKSPDPKSEGNDNEDKAADEEDATESSQLITEKDDTL